MRRGLAAIVVVGSLALASSAQALPSVLVSQVYGGGGTSTGSATYSTDYVEIFNRSASEVDLSGWSLQYGSAAGTFGSSSTNIFPFPSGTKIGGHKYLLVRSSAAGSVGATLTPAADLVSDFTMAAAAGKVALADQVLGLGCGSAVSRCSSTHIADMVGYGSTASDFEGAAPTAGTTTTSGAVRKSLGCTDTDDNLSDFDVVSGPVPHNSATPRNYCGGAVATGTSVSCAAPSVAGVPKDCSATVTDLETGTTPTGTVTFTSPGDSFAPAPTCTLQPASGTGATCQVTFTPAGSGLRTVTAAYGGDTGYGTSSGGTSVDVAQRADAIAASCSLSPTTVHDQVCSITITDLNGVGDDNLRPTGTVTGVFTGTLPHGEGGNVSCPLAAASAPRASACVVTVHGVTGDQSLGISWQYPGDASYAPVQGNRQIDGERASTVTVSCAPSPVHPGEAASCTATVADNDQGAVVSPTGTIAFATDGAGAFGATGQCTLAPAGTGITACSVPYTPSAVGSGMHRISATYTPNVSYRRAVSGALDLAVAAVAAVDQSTAGGDQSPVGGTGSPQLPPASSTSPPPPCTVPALRGKTLAQARALLKKAHCALGAVKRVKSKKVKRGRVISQSVAARKKVPAGRKIALVVSK
jgi:hypothetical protein